jgi:arginase family enzyme
VPREVELVGVPTNSSGTVDGVARAPAVLRQRGLPAALAGMPGVTDAGDLALPAPQSRRGPSGVLAEEALITMIGRVAGAVRAARGRGRFPVELGGDCPVMLGALAALQDEQDRPGLLFVDGHEDAWPPLASPTGRRPIVSSGWRWGCSTPRWIGGCAASFPGSAAPMSLRSVPATVTSSPPRASRHWRASCRR